MIFKKRELVFSEITKKIEAEKDYSLEEIAGLFKLSVIKIEKWCRIGFVAEEETRKTFRLPVKENHRVSGRELLHFIDRAHLNKALFDMKYETILQISIFFPLSLVLLSVVISDNLLPAFGIMLLGVFAMIPIIAWREVRFLNYSRIGLDAWKPIRDYERDSASVGIRSRVKRKKWIVFFWFGALLFICLFRGKILNPWRFKYQFEQYIYVLVALFGWTDVLGFIFEQNMFARTTLSIKPNYENRIVRWAGFFQGLLFMAVGILYFCKK